MLDGDGKELSSDSEQCVDILMCVCVCVCVHVISYGGIVCLRTIYLGNTCQMLGSNMYWNLSG
jgi:uncharacterized sporulation protein YeaH/YhbH (DUF444 family)